MEPTCPRCGQPLDPLESVASPQGPVHRGCAQPLDVMRPVFDETDVSRAAPKYGAPPIRRLIPLTVVGSIVTLIVWLIRRC